MHNLFKSYRNSVNKIARLRKANHYKNFFEDNKNKLNRYQRDYQHQQKNTQQIRSINNNGKLITEKKHTDESQCLGFSPLDICVYFVAGKTLNKQDEFF